MPPRDQNPYVAPKLFKFLRDLKRHNEREWFEENKERYEAHVREPLLAFIDDFSEPLYKISPHFRADSRKVGGSLFRIYRDVRFSKDKSPYKTHAGIHFRHEAARDVHAPGFYLHLQPGEVFIGVGIWHPDRETATKIRQAIVEHPDRWQKAVENATFREQFGLSGDSLKRAPAGVDADHPLIEDLKRKDFVAVKDSSEKEVCEAQLTDSFAGACTAAKPFMKFLTEAVGLPW